MKGGNLNCILSMLFDSYTNKVLFIDITSFYIPFVFTDIEIGGPVPVSRLFGATVK